MVNEAGVDAGDVVLETIEDWHRPDLEARVHAAVGQAWLGTDAEASKEALETATTLGDTAGDPSLRANLWLRWGLVAQQSWDVETVRRTLARAESAAGAVTEPSVREPLEARILLLSIFAELNEGNPVGAREELQEARRRAQRIPDLIPKVAELSVILSELDGDPEATLNAQRTLLEWRTTHGLTSSEDLAQGLVDIAELELEFGRLDAAKQLCDEARALFPDAEASLIRRVQVDAVAARVAAERGEFDDAASLLEPHLRAGHQPGDVLIARGGVLVLEGRFDEASDVLARATSVAGLNEPSAIGGAILAVAPRAIALRRSGRSEQARALLSPVFQWHSENYPKILTTQHAALTMAWLDLDTDQVDAALDAFDRLRETLHDPVKRAWADVGFAISSARSRGSVSKDDRALVERAVALFSERAPACGYELRISRAWLAGRGPAGTR